MEHPVISALWLMQRQKELEMNLQAKAGVRHYEEQELLAVRSRLTRYPQAVKAITAVAQILHRPVEGLSAEDVFRNA